MSAGAVEPGRAGEVERIAMRLCRDLDRALPACRPVAGTRERCRGWLGLSDLFDVGFAGPPAQAAASGRPR